MASCANSMVITVTATWLDESITVLTNANLPCSLPILSVASGLGKEMVPYLYW